MNGATGWDLIFSGSRVFYSQAAFCSASFPYKKGFEQFLLYTEIVKEIPIFDRGIQMQL